ncbi:MAG: FN3 associated domain-containing protein [Cellulophaga sp.]
MQQLAIQIGNFHPVLVHLPIGILFLVFIIELFFRKKKTETLHNIVLLGLFVGTLAALASLGTGWWLADSGGYDEEMIFRHRWMGVAFTIGTTLLLILKKTNSSLGQKIYLPLFSITIILLTITGHLGGNMTHGEDFLFKNNSAEIVAITDIDKALAYEDIIKPILQNKCVSCHNSSKPKGGLLLTSPKNILAGGDTGNILDSTAGKLPLLLHSIHLPMSEETHMPPKGKVQLTEDEITLIEWWINNKHCFDCTTKNIEQSEQLHLLLLSLEEDTSPRALIAKEVDEKVPEKWINSLEKEGIIVYYLDKESPLLIVNMANRTNLKKEHFKLLKKYAPNIVELNLSNSNFSDTLATFLPSFKNLTKLQLQRTAITDKTIEKINNLNFLESLNLYGTKVSNVTLYRLSSFSYLKNIYVWKTEIDRGQIEKFNTDFPTIAVQLIKDDLFALASLDPPNINSKSIFFKDSLEVSLEYVFNEIDIYYTQDGSEPDSTSIKYTKPLTLTKSTEIKAVTYKKGLGISKVFSENFKQSSISYDTIWVNTPPNKNYAAQGAKSLIDQNRGSLNFVDGNWLAYEGSHFKATLGLTKKTKISTVSIGVFASPEKWIFYPVNYKIWTSLDGITYKLIHTTNNSVPDYYYTTERNFINLKVPPTNAKFVRVEVKSLLKNPKWHPNPGGKSWIFVDEIVLN